MQCCTTWNSVPRECEVPTNVKCSWLLMPCTVAARSSRSLSAPGFVVKGGRGGCWSGVSGSHSLVVV